MQFSIIDSGIIIFIVRHINKQRYRRPKRQAVTFKGITVRHKQLRWQTRMLLPLPFLPPFLW